MQKFWKSVTIWQSYREFGNFFRHSVHCVSKNDTDAAHYNFDADKQILIIFGRDVAKRVRDQTLIYYPN